MDAPEEQKKRTNQRAPMGYRLRTNQRAPMGYWLKTLRRLSQKRAPTLLESINFREIVRTLICEGLGVFIVA